MQRNIRFKDLTNQQFGYLTALYVDKSKSTTHHTYWICQCVCGETRSLQTYQLTSRKVTSCGCKNLFRKKNYATKDVRLYSIYNAMIQRCYNPKCVGYKSYGKKGIYVCDEWKNDFSSFQQWAYSNGYQSPLSIDRIDNAKGYEPSNCRWIPFAEQSRNKTNNVNLTHNNETHIMSEWCELLNFPYSLAKSRSKYLRKNGLELTFEYIFAPNKKPRKKCTDL